MGTRYQRCIMLHVAATAKTSAYDKVNHAFNSAAWKTRKDLSVIC